MPTFSGWMSRIRRWSHRPVPDESERVLKPGSGAAPQLVIVCARYDRIMEQHGNATARAPRTDDNASGIAAVFEIARILKDVDLEDTVRLVAFSGEEQAAPVPSECPPSRRCDWIEER